MDLVTKHFEHMKPRENGFHSAKPKIVQPRIILRNKKALEQVCSSRLGVPCHPIAHEQRHAGYERSQYSAWRRHEFPASFKTSASARAWLYSIYSDLNPYRDTVARMPRRLCRDVARLGTTKVVQSVVEEFRKLKQETVSEEELCGVPKISSRAAWMLSLESSTARMSNLARQEMYLSISFYDFSMN